MQANTIRFYSLVMDSVKLFFLNVFLYTLFLEVYILAYLFQLRYGLELSFAAPFTSGIFTFLFITIWMNVAHVWYHSVKSQQELVQRAVLSELPIIFFMLITLLVGYTAHLTGAARTELLSLYLLFVLYLFLFPLVFALAKSHRKKIDSL